MSNLIEQASLAARGEKPLEAAANALADIYMDTRESIFIKKYKIFNRDTWGNLVRIMEQRSIEGEYKREYIDGSVDHFLFIALNIGQELMDEYLRPKKDVKHDILDEIFYTPLLHHVVEVLEKANERHTISKWDEFLKMWQEKRKEIINPSYRYWMISNILSSF